MSRDHGIKNPQYREKGSMDLSRPSAREEDDRYKVVTPGKDEYHWDIERYKTHLVAEEFS